jgi:hypothetical protein
MLQLAYVGGRGLMAGPGGTHLQPDGPASVLACTTAAQGRSEMPFAPAGKPMALSL